MISKASLLLLLLLAVFALSCSEERGADGDAESNDDSTGEETPAESGPSGMLVEGMGTVVDVITGGAIENAEVCLFMEYDIGCVYTDASGKFTLPGLPAGALRGTQIRKQGHDPIISWFTVPNSSWSLSEQLVPQLVAAAILDAAGGQDTSRGHIVVRAVDASGSPLAGAKLDTVPPTEHAAAYLGDDGMPDANLTASGTNGLIVVPNVVEGAIDIRVNDFGGQSCTPDSTAEAGNGPTMTRVRVLAGHWAVVPGFDFVCG